MYNFNIHRTLNSVCNSPVLQILLLTLRGLRPLLYQRICSSHLLHSQARFRKRLLLFFFFAISYQKTNQCAKRQKKKKNKIAREYLSAAEGTTKEIFACK